MCTLLITYCKQRIVKSNWSVIVNVRHKETFSKGRNVSPTFPVNFYPRVSIRNKVVEMQTRLHFLHTYETYPRIIQTRPIVRIHPIFRVWLDISALRTYPCISRSDRIYVSCVRACVHIGIWITSLLDYAHLDVTLGNHRIILLFP